MWIRGISRGHGPVIELKIVCLLILAAARPLVTYRIPSCWKNLQFSSSSGDELTSMHSLLFLQSIVHIQSLGYANLLQASYPVFGLKELSDENLGKQLST